VYVCGGGIFLFYNLLQLRPFYFRLFLLSMADPSVTRLTPHNYHTWKAQMTRLLMSRGLWSCLDEQQPALTRPFEVLHHRNKMDEAMGLIALNISESLLFHLDGLNNPRGYWHKFETLFGQVNEFRALQLDAELTSLSPSSFPTIEDFLVKFKSLRAVLQGCGKNKADADCIFLILSKLRGPYQIFSSTFYSTMDALGDRFRMPTFETFCERLTREQSKIQQVDASGSSQALVAQNFKGKSKKKDKKKDTSKSDSKPPATPTNPSKGKDSSKSGESTSKAKKKSSETCSFCGKDGHSVSRCWKRL